jgi:6-phosphogluconolactonase
VGLESLAIDPAGKFLYVVGDQSAIQSFSIDSTSGELTAASVVTESSNPDFRAVIMSPSGKFLYVNDLTLGRIFAYTIGPEGTLSAVAGSPFTLPAAAGSFLYVVNYPDGPVDGFRVDPDTGALTLVPGSPFPASEFAGSATADATGKFLYVSDYSNSMIYGFTIDSGTGLLTSVPGSPFPSVPQPVLMGPLNIP